MVGFRPSSNGLGPGEQLSKPQGEGRMATPSTAAPSVAAINPTSGRDASRSSSPYLGDGTRTPSYSTPTRAPYVPQFSAATQMILKRMRGEGGGLTSALASATAPGAIGSFRTKFPQPAYESVREKIILSMSNESTMSMPAPPSSPSATGTTASLPPKPTPKATPVNSDAKSPATVALAGQKRKRGKDDVASGSNSGLPSSAEASDYGEGIKKATPKPAAIPTTTKSGRHIQKPDTYDPAAEDMAKKTARSGKRTSEQALCKKCTRMHSPANNQIVFCDGCNDPWHQHCHDPWIVDEVIREHSLKWYCASCQAKRDRLQPRKKVVVDQPRMGSWAGKSTNQKRAYLSSLPQGDLVNLLIHATELHPDLPIFPIFPAESSTPKKAAVKDVPRSLFAATSTDGLFTRIEANPMGRMNFIRKIPANAKKSTLAKARSGTGSLQSKAAAQAKAIANAPNSKQLDDEESSFTRLWPKPGKGMYSRLPPEADDDGLLVDDNDYDVFSVIVYNEKGKKIEENGVKV